MSLKGAGESTLLKRVVMYAWQTLIMRLASGHIKEEMLEIRDGVIRSCFMTTFILLTDFAFLFIRRIVLSSYFVILSPRLTVKLRPLELWIGNCVDIFFFKHLIFCYFHRGRTLLHVRWIFYSNLQLQNSRCSLGKAPEKTLWQELEALPHLGWSLTVIWHSHYQTFYYWFLDSC